MGAGRPTKLTTKVIQVWKEILDENVLFATDEELFLLLNERLDEKERIGYTTFKDWKAGRSPEHNELFDEFSSVIKRSLLAEKKRLLHNLQGDKQAWQRFAWIIERKFDEWNIRNKIEQTVSAKVETKLIRPDGSEWTVENNEGI
jgi:hypothetical protein